MAFNPNIPQPTDLISNSQNDILQNFQTINTAFNVNHIAMNLGDQGKHKFLQMPEQAGPPVTAVDEGGLFAAEGQYSTITELFWRQENNGLTLPMTERNNAAIGWSFLPSGMLIKWGIATAIGVTTYNFPDDGDVHIPSFTQVYSAVITTINNTPDTMVQLIAFTTASIFVNSLSISALPAVVATDTNFTYFVIGV